MDYEVKYLLATYIRRNPKKYTNRILFYEFDNEDLKNLKPHPIYSYLYTYWWNVYKFGYQDLDRTNNKLVEYINILSNIHIEEEQYEMQKLKRQSSLRKRRF